MNNLGGNHDIDRQVASETKLVQDNNNKKKVLAVLLLAQTLIYYNICS